MGGGLVWVSAGLDWGVYIYVWECPIKLGDLKNILGVNPLPHWDGLFKSLCKRLHYLDNCSIVVTNHNVHIFYHFVLFCILCWNFKWWLLWRSVDGGHCFIYKLICIETFFQNTTCFLKICCLILSRFLTFICCFCPFSILLLLVHFQYVSEV